MSRVDRRANPFGMTTKRAYCSCCSTGSRHPIWDATSRRDADANEVPTWECRCCHQTMPRRVVRKPRPIGELTFENVLAEIRAKLST